MHETSQQMAGAFIQDSIGGKPFSALSQPVNT
jgi:hypothetical protein